MTHFTQEQAVEMVVQIGADEKDCPWATLTPEELTALVNLAADRAAEAATKHQDEQQRQIAEREAVIEELRDLAIWMTGAYPFADHDYFVSKRHLLLSNTDHTALDEAIKQAKVEVLEEFAKDIRDVIASQAIR